MKMFKRFISPLLVVLGLALAPLAHASGPSTLFNSFIFDEMAGNITVNTDTFWCMLVDSTFTPNKATQTKRSDITGEVTGTGYTAGGKVCTVTGSNDNANNRYNIAIGVVTWSASTITARAMVIYKRRGGASSADELLGTIDFGGNVSSTAGDFTVTTSTPFRITNPN